VGSVESAGGGRRRTQTVLFVLTLAVAGVTTAGVLGAAAAPTAARARSHHAGALRLSVTPTHVRQGGRLVLHGAGFPARARVLLLARPPHGPRRSLGTARAGSRGGFDASIRIARGATRGAYVAVACPASCTRKATATFHVTRAR
jgi:hypothetical protein